MNHLLMPVDASTRGLTAETRLVLRVGLSQVDLFIHYSYIITPSVHIISLTHCTLLCSCVFVHVTEHFSLYSHHHTSWLLLSLIPVFSSSHTTVATPSLSHPCLPIVTHHGCYSLHLIPLFSSLIITHHGCSHITLHTSHGLVATLLGGHGSPIFCSHGGSSASSHRADPLRWCRPSTRYYPLILPSYNY